MGWHYKTEHVWVPDASLDSSWVTSAAAEKMEEEANHGWEYVSMTLGPTNGGDNPGWRATIIFRRQD